MFQTGQFKFKPHLRGDLLDDLQDVAAEADYFTISPDKLEMNDIAFNWLSGDVNKNLVKTSIVFGVMSGLQPNIPPNPVAHSFFRHSCKIRVFG